MKTKNITSKARLLKAGGINRGLKTICTLLFIMFFSLSSSYAQLMDGGNLHSLALCNDGRVFATGFIFGGVGSTTTPVQVPGLSNIIVVDAGRFHNMALRNDGTVFTWGSNLFGQLGDGTTTQRLTPAQVPGLSNIVAISAGFFHSMALRNDGTVFTWGFNANGRLGDGTTTNRTIPVQVLEVGGVGFLSNITAIYAGGEQCMALRNDAVVIMWGSNVFGQFANGTTSAVNTTAVVSGFSNIIAVASGRLHSVVLKSDGTVQTSGLNSSGQLGDGTTTNRLIPTPVSGLSNITSISASEDFHSMALRSDGTVFTWGNNSNGQLGDGTTINRTIPVIVSSLSGIVAIAAAAGNHSLALRNDGTVFTWGENAFGQLGDGTTTDRTTPVQMQLICTVGVPPTPLVLTTVTTNVSCNGGSDGTADLTVSNGVLPLTFAWSNGATTEDLTGLSAGTFNVTVTDANGCTATDSVTILDGTLTIPDASFGIAGDSCFRDTASFTSTFTSGTHFWDFGDGSPTSTDVNPTHVFPSEGTFEVIHIVTNICDTDTVKLDVTRLFCCPDGNLPLSSNPSLNFDGVNDRVTIPGDIAYELGASDFTLEASIQTTASGFLTILSRRSFSSGTNSDAFLFLVFNGKLLLQINGTANTGSGSGNRIDTQGPLVNDGICHHVAVRRSSGNIRFFVDGAITPTIHFETSDMNSDNGASQSLIIGRDIPSVNQYNGKIDEVRIWNLARTIQEISGSSSISLTGTETGLIGYWEMDESGGQTVIDNSVTANNGFLGSTLIVDGNDPVRTTSSCFLVCCPPPADASFTAPDSVCRGNTVIFTSTDTTGTHFWDFGDGSPTSTDVNPTHVYTPFIIGAVSFTVTHIVTNACDSDTVTQNIIVFPPPAAAFGVLAGPCTNTNVRGLQIITSGTHFWDFGDGRTSTAASPVIAYPTGGTFTITHIVTNPCGSDTATQTVTVIGLPDASFTVSGDSCFLDTVFFASADPTGTHSWDFGDLSTSTDVNPTHLYPSNGTFTVTHIVSNSCRTSLLLSGPLTIQTDTVTQNVTRLFCCVGVPPCSNPTFTSILGSDNNMFISMDICDRDLNVCADNQIFDFTIKHRGLISDTIDSLKFTIDLPTGISFGSFTVLESPGGSITFDIPSLTFSLPPLPPDSTFRIQVTVVVNCDIVPFAQAGNPILVGAETNYEVLTVPFTLTGTDPESYNIENGDLIIVDITNQFFIGNVGDTYVRKISVLNGGNGSLSSFDLTETFDLGISVNGSLASLVRTFIDIDFTNNPDPSSNGDCFFDRDEILIICDTVLILNCDSAKTQIDATFGCDGDTCVDNGDVAFANTLISNGGPNFTIPLVQYIPTNYCSPDTGTVTYRYRNNGFEVDPGGARANDIRVVFRATTAVSTLINFELNGVPLSSIAGLFANPILSGPYTYYVINFTNLAIDPDGPGGIDDLDGDGFFDNLEKNSSFTITADIVMSCPNEFAVECPANFYHEIVRTWINYRDQCKLNRPRRYGRNFRVRGFRRFKPSTSGPPELADGETGTYCFKFDYRIRGLQNMSCNNTRPQGLVILPAGFSAVPGSASAGGAPTTFTQSNDTVFIVGVPLTIINSDRKRCFQEFCIDLTLDCNDPNLAFISKVKFEKRYECDSTCSCAIRMGCTSIEVKNLCTCEDTLITTLDFEAVRTTLGWTNRFRTTFISPTTAGIRLDRVYECDSIRTCAPGVVLTNSITNAQVTITNGVFGNDTILIPSTAFFIITDVSSSTTVTCPAGPPVITNAGTNPDLFMYTYDATPCIVANFGGVLNLGDSIKLVADFGIKKSSTIPNQTITEFSCFTATHSTIISADTITCDSRGTRMYVLKSTIETVLRRPAFASTCGEARRTLRFRAIGGTCGDDDFPNEFRNLYRIGDTVEFFLPTGYTFVPGSGRFTTEGGVNIPIELPVITNGVATFRMGDNSGFVDWPLQDKNGNTESNLFFNITPSCEAEEEPTTDSVRFDFVNYNFAADPACFDSIFDVIRRSSVHHLTPHIDIEAKLPSIAGFNPVDTFCIRLCNDLVVPLDTALIAEPTIDTVDFPLYTAPNAWLVFDNSSGGLDILFAIDTTGGASDTLEIIGLSGDSILVNTDDSIALFDCRFILLLVSSKSCAPTDIDSVTVTGGWSCSFLDSITDIACLQDTDRLFFHPQESAKQVSLIRPVDNVFDACAPVEYELEIVNTRLPRIYDIAVQAQLPAGMTYVSNSSKFKFPLTSPFVSIPESLVTVSGDTITYIIDSLDADIDSLGLEGVTDLVRNKFRIKFEVITGCDYTSGSVVEFTVSCFTNCDSLIVFSFTTDPQFLTGALPEYSTNINADSDGFINCSDSTQVTFNILNNGPASTNPTDSVEILLPEGISFINGSFVGINNPPTHNAPDQFAIGAETLLKWDLPNGVPLGGSMQFSIGISSNSVLDCGSIELAIATTFQDTADCVLPDSLCLGPQKGVFINPSPGNSGVQVPAQHISGKFTQWNPVQAVTQGGNAPSLSAGLNIIVQDTCDSVCFIDGIAGSINVLIDVLKPKLDLSGFSATVACTFSVMSVDVSNIGIDVPAGTTTQVDFYCDNDASGDLSVGDSFLGSLSTISAIAAGDTVTLADTLQNVCSNDIIAVIDDSVNCTCEGVEVITEPLNIVAVTATIDCCADTFIACGDQVDILISFEGDAPFTFTYTDGTDTFSVTTSSNPFVLNVSPVQTTTFELISVISNNICEGTVCGRATIGVNSCTNQCLDNCFSTEITGVLTSDSCRTITLTITCDSTCQSALSHLDVSVPCGQIVSVTNSAGFPIEFIDPEPNSGISGFKIDDVEDFCEDGNTDTMTVTYTVCSDSTTCSEAICEPLVSYKAGQCTFYGVGINTVMQAKMAPVDQETEAMEVTEEMEELAEQMVKIKTKSLRTAIYPNPTTGFLTVELFSDRDAQVMIYNAPGEIVGIMDGKELPSNKFEFDLSNLGGGVYFVHIITDEELVVKRVVYIK